MKELNEDIKRLRQIMSYNRGKGLLINESQYDMNEQYNDEGQLDLNTLAKEIAISQKYSEIADEMTPSDFGDEFEFADNFITYLLDEYEDSDFYDDLYDEFKMEYGDTILNIYLSDDDV